jgi:tape measure domain-containing protein
MATTNAANKMQRAFNQTTVATNQTNQSILTLGRSVTSIANSFKGLFAIGLIMQGARAVASYADTWKEATNKIGAAAQISGKQAATMDELVAVSIRTRSSIDDIADTYSKLLRTTADLEIAQGKQVQMTETVAEAFKAGGASMLEQVNAIRQLGQALGSGILQGDELRSIRENAPLIAKAIAEEFDVSIAGLKRLGAEGQLTSDRVAKAIIDHQDEIHAAFMKTSATFGDSFTILTTGLTRYVGKLNEASKASNGLFIATEFLVEHLDKIFSLSVPPWLSVYVSLLERIASETKSVVDAYNNANTTIVPKNIMPAPPGSPPPGLYGPEQGLDYEGIAKRAQEAESAVSKLKSTQHDWATQTEVTEVGKLQADAYKHLAEYIKETETPFETYKRTLAEVAVLERDHALAADLAFRERAKAFLTFSNTALGAAGAMSGALTQLFKNNKAVAIANAVINTAEAITAALKNPPGPPFSYVYAAAAAVAGAAQIATIMSTQPGSGSKTPTVKSGGGAAAVSSATTAAGEASGKRTPSQTVNITVQGESGFTAQQVRELIGHINEAVGDGVHLRVS